MVDAQAGVVWHNGHVATPQSLVGGAKSEGAPVSKRFSQPNRSQMSAGPSASSDHNVIDRLSSGFSRSGLSTRSHDSVQSDDDDGYDLVRGTASRTQRGSVRAPQLTSEPL